MLVGDTLKAICEARMIRVLLDKIKRIRTKENIGLPAPNIKDVQAGARTTGPGKAAAWAYREVEVSNIPQPKHVG